MAEEEIWKVYPDYPFVEVSNLGRVRTKDRYVPSKNGSKRLVKGRILKQQLFPCGYMYVHIRADGKSVNLRVHRMVAITFIPNPDNLPEVNHIDCDRTNNRVDNLEWCTPQYNSEYRNKLGHWVNNTPGHPVIVVDLNSFKVFWFESQMEAKRQLGICGSHISAVVNGKRQQTHGYWFTNADSTAVEKTRSKFGNEIADKVEKLIRKIL